MGVVVATWLEQVQLSSATSVELHARLLAVGLGGLLGGGCLAVGLGGLLGGLLGAVAWCGLLGAG